MPAAFCIPASGLLLHLSRFPSTGILFYTLSWGGRKKGPQTGQLKTAAASSLAILWNDAIKVWAGAPSLERLHGRVLSHLSQLLRAPGVQGRVATSFQSLPLSSRGLLCVCVFSAVS